MGVVFLGCLAIFIFRILNIVKNRMVLGDELEETKANIKTKTTIK